jgi:hypothetical protein
MDNALAIDICEGMVTPESEEEVIQAWQHLIDTALVWQLQGWYGRTATHLIEEGICNAVQNKRGKT